jgi:hypothetical protein
MRVKIFPFTKRYKKFRKLMPEKAVQGRKANSIPFKIPCFEANDKTGLKP